MTRMRKRRKSMAQRVKENAKIQTLSTFLLPILFGILVIFLWQEQYLHSFFHTDTFTLPLPTRIIEIMRDNGE